MQYLVIKWNYDWEEVLVIQEDELDEVIFEAEETSDIIWTIAKLGSRGGVYMGVDNVPVGDAEIVYKKEMDDER